MNDKLVSIAMATYNGEKFIKEQIESILNQTYKNIEIIICDDSSIDSTFKILEEYAEKDNRIKLYKNEKNLGFVKNFEKTISLSNGDYIALSDQDDIWRNNKIQKLVENIGTYDLIHSAASLIDENSNIISEKWIKQDNFKYTFEKLIFGNTITGCTVLFKKSLLKEYFPIPSGEKYHDWWLALLATKNNGIKYLDEILVYYRQHGFQDTGAKVESSIDKFKRYFCNIFCKYKSDRYKKSIQQINRLESFLRERKELFNTHQIQVIKDALMYHKDYIENFIHVKSFTIGLKYRHFIYEKYPLIKCFVRDILC